MSGITKETIGDCTLYLGDCLEILPTLDRVDALITDPPYSSGGQFRSDRCQKTRDKYVQSGSEETCLNEFSGDNKDQRAFLAWSALWLGYCLQKTAPGGIACIFTDWRQLPTMTDAIQSGGWVWRNLVTWWKPGIRMQHGRFSSSAEFIVYGSKGVPTAGEFSLQNVVRCAPVQSAKKQHMAEKPIALIKELLGVTPPASTILDPFMGSGTTGMACISSGREFIGIELDSISFETACKRIEKVHKQRRFFSKKPKPSAQPSASNNAQELEPDAARQKAEERQGGQGVMFGESR